jgi:hypothetical protein
MSEEYSGTAGLRCLAVVVLRLRRLLWPRATHHEAGEQLTGGLGYVVDGMIENVTIVSGGDTKARDLTDVLQSGGPDVVVTDLRRVGRSESLDAAAHTSILRHECDSAHAIGIGAMPAPLPRREFENFEPKIGRTGLELIFTAGSVRCENWSGDLRLSG